MPQELRHEPTDRAAADNRWLRPLVITLYAVASLGILFEYWLVPIFNLLGTDVSFWTGFSRLAVGWVEAGSTIALAWTLWEADLYLQRVEKGDPWTAALKTFMRRVGVCLLVAAVWADIIAPSVAAGMAGRGWFEWVAEPQMMVLAGLGLVFIGIARRFGNS